jgi:hypothetical protein
MLGNNFVDSGNSTGLRFSEDLVLRSLLQIAKVMAPPEKSPKARREAANL